MKDCYSTPGLVVDMHDNSAALSTDNAFGQRLRNILSDVTNSDGYLYVKM